MAWSIKNRGSKYCVVNDDTGRSVKCYTTITEAEAHRRALASSKSDARAKVSALNKKVGPRRMKKTTYK